MTADYIWMKKELPKLKGALTRAKKKGPEAVIAEVDRAFAIFDEVGFPVMRWRDWTLAKRDAAYELETGRKNEPVPGKQYRLTGPGSIAEGRTWEEAAIEPGEDEGGTMTIEYIGIGRD